MTKQWNQPRRWRALCANLRPDDGVDPKRDVKPEARDAAADRRLGRLCSEVRHALRLALAACADPDLQALDVFAVEPAPDAGRLRALVGPALLTADMDAGAILAKLDALTGHLRAEVAAAVVRKRAPGLVFSVQPDPGREGQP